MQTCRRVDVVPGPTFSRSCFPQGYAYTFITEDQARYGGEIVKALELSGAPVPPELEKLWSSFKDQQKAVRTYFATTTTTTHNTAGTRWFR